MPVIESSRGEKIQISLSKLFYLAKDRIETFGFRDKKKDNLNYFSKELSMA